jgi:meso-butanediol dehydrogenase/(S,S)-butanediol dehydrogenase/diacetyl reductase
MDQHWTDKIVIVTGGGGGMGQAAAKRFADAGAKTFVFGRTLESLQESAALSPNIIPVVCDVADGASVAAAMETVLKTGTPHALIHTAGINTPDRFMAHADPSRIASEESWRKVMEINVIGVANMIQAVAKPMAANGGGKIVVVSSTAGHGYDSFAGVPYTASKWAVHGMLFTARMQLNAHGIVVSEYAPGEADTPARQKAPCAALRQAQGSHDHLRRLRRRDVLHRQPAAQHEHRPAPRLPALRRHAAADHAAVDGCV